MGLFRTQPGRPLIAPSMLAANFARAGDEARAALEAGADLLHLDIMDGHFVPNLTMGPDMCRGLRHELPHAFLDVHLMVEDPGKFVEPFAKAGANHITFHWEAPALASGAMGPEASARRLAMQVHDLGLTVGISIRPRTPIAVLTPCLDAFDLVLIMSVEPGFGGQAFMPESTGRAAAVAARLQPRQRLEMDGGLAPATAPSAIAAGVDVLVVGSALFGRPRPMWQEVISQCRTQC